MTKTPLDIVLGNLVGTQLAIVHLVNVLVHTGAFSREEIAGSFRSTAELVPQDAMNKDAIQQVLRHIASGIEQNSQDLSAALNDLLH